MSDDILQRDHRSIRGKILYTSKKPDRMDQERGRENFSTSTYTATAHVPSPRIAKLTIDPA